MEDLNDVDRKLFFLYIKLNGSLEVLKVLVFRVTKELDNFVTRVLSLWASLWVAKMQQQSVGRVEYSWAAGNQWVLFVTVKDIYIFAIAVVVWVMGNYCMNKYVCKHVWSCKYISLYVYQFICEVHLFANLTVLLSSMDSDVEYEWGIWFVLRTVERRRGVIK